MHHGGVHLSQPRDFAIRQVDGVTIDTAGAQQSVGFVGIEVVARGWEQLLDPCDFVDLFGQVRLHQAVGVFRPKRAEGRELVRR